MCTEVRKIVVVGDECTGKTALLVAYGSNSFVQKYVPTIFDNYTAGTEHQGKIFLLSLWDTPGCPQYAKLRSLSYVEADVFLICFDVGNRVSFDNVPTWYNEVKTLVPEAKVILVGTKIDTRTSASVSISEAKALARKLKLNSYVECSSLDQQGVSCVFNTALDITTKSSLLHSWHQLQKRQRNNCSVM